MKALVVHEFRESFSELRVSEIPNAEAQDGAVLIRVAAAGVNFVDTLYVRTCTYHILNLANQVFRPEVNTRIIQA